MEINVRCYLTVRRAKIIAEIGSVLPENKETWYGLHHKVTPVFILPPTIPGTLAPLSEKVHPTHGLPF